MEETFGSLLRTVQQAQSQIMNVVSDRGVTGSQLSVLSAAVNSPGIDQRGVTAATFIDKSTVASVVTKLIERGLLTSSRSGADGRRDRLVPTKTAIALTYDASSRLQAENDALLTALPAAKREKFLEQLRQIAYADRYESPEVYVIPSPDEVRPPLEVRWGLGRSLRGCLQRYGRLWTEQFGSLVTPVQYLALQALEKADRIDQNTLGGIIALDKATLTVMLTRLQRRGLIAKHRDAADGRRRVLLLTPPAHVLLSGVAGQVPTLEAEFVSPLPPGQHVFFADALRDLAAAMRRPREKRGEETLDTSPRATISSV